MSKIKDAFTKGKAFIPFISAGDHGIETTERYIRVMVKAGADMVEIGIPSPIQRRKVQLSKKRAHALSPQA